MGSSNCICKEKNNEIRICADYSTGLNDCLKERNLPLPTAKEIFENFNGTRIFSKLDLSEAYLQISVVDYHHYVVPLARISLTFSRHFSLLFIASGRSSGIHPVSSYSCSMYVRAGRPAFAWSYAGVHRSTSLMSSSLLLQQCPACLVLLAWIVFVMGGRWVYSWCLKMSVQNY